MNCNHRTPVIHGQDSHLRIKPPNRSTFDVNQPSQGDRLPLTTVEHRLSLHPFTVRSKPQPILLHAKSYEKGQAMLVNGIVGLPQSVSRSRESQQREKESHAFGDEIGNARPIDMGDGYGDPQIQGGYEQLLQMPVITPSQVLYVAGAMLYAGTTLRFVGLYLRDSHQY